MRYDTPCRRSCHIGMRTLQVGGNRPAHRGDITARRHPAATTGPHGSCIRRRLGCFFCVPSRCSPRRGEAPQAHAAVGHNRASACGQLRPRQTPGRVVSNRPTHRHSTGRPRTGREHPPFHQGISKWQASKERAAGLAPTLAASGQALDASQRQRPSRNQQISRQWSARLTPKTRHLETRSSFCLP